LSFKKNGKTVKLQIDNKRVRVRHSVSTGRRASFFSSLFARKDSRKSQLARDKNYYSRCSLHFHKDRGHTVVKSPVTFGRAVLFLRKWAGKAVAVATAAALVFGAITVFELRIGCEVIVNGKTVGVVTDKAEFERILDDAQQIVQMASEEEPPVISAVYVPRLVSEKNVTSEFNLEQNVLANFDMLIEAYALYVDHSLICATMQESDMFTALEDIKGTYATENCEAEFEGEVVVRKEFVPIANLVSKDGVEVALSGNKREIVVYIATAGDTVGTIASAYGMTEEELLELNGVIVEGEIPEGAKLQVVQVQPLAAVRTESTEEYTEILGYTTQTVEAPDLLVGRSKVVGVGENGEKAIVARVVRINGVEVERIIESEVVVREPSDETVKVGTRDAGTNVSIVAGAGSGQFIRPVYGTISSRYGQRWGRKHEGLDFSCPVGTSIYAADNGTVVYSGWDGGYGYHVKIDHGNGVVTCYAHNSQLIVPVGAYVNKGDVISKSGNTGNSTGPHLHFEVRVNGVAVNPESYL